jgi:uncharacterized protein (DUF1778 family)
MKAVSQQAQSRVDFRVSAAVKNKLQQAALYENGGDLSAFLIAAGLERAERVLAHHDAIVLEDGEMRRRFYAALRDTSPPTEVLRHFLAEDDARIHLVE